MSDTKQIKLAFSADVSAVKRELKDLRTDLDSLTLNLKSTDKNGNFNTQINNTISLIAQLQGQLDAATTKTGSIKLDVLAKEFNKVAQPGQNATNVMAQYVNTLRSLSSAYPEAGRAADRFVNQVQSAYDPMNKLNGVLGEAVHRLGGEIIKTFNYALINKFTQSIGDAVSYAKHLNANLTDIRIVSGQSAEQMAEFAKYANNAAKALGATTNEYVKGALIYYQQGLSDEEVKARTDTTIKLANTSGESADAISSYMTSIWNNFDDGTKSLEYYADALSYLGAVSAASNADIAQGLQSFAATANTVGLSYEYATAALTTLVDKTQQSASTIGNSLKTIFARLESLKLGETLEDGVDLTKYTQALSTVGVEVLDTNGELRDMDSILDDLASKWDTLSRAQKNALAQTVGGVRQYNNLISLMDNYDAFQGFAQGAADSEGFLNKQNTVYLESWYAAMDQLEASWEKIYSILIDDKLIITITKGLASIVDSVGTLTQNLGGLSTLLPVIATLVMSIAGDKVVSNVNRITSGVIEFFTFNSKIGKGTQGRELRDKAFDLGINIDLSNDRDKDLNGIIDAQQEQVKAYIENRQKMSQADRVATEEILKRNKEIVTALVEQRNEFDKIGDKYRNAITGNGEAGNYDIAEELKNNYRDKAQLEQYSNPLLEGQEDSYVQNLQNKLQAALTSDILKTDEYIQKNINDYISLDDKDTKQEIAKFIYDHIKGKIDDIDNAIDKNENEALKNIVIAKKKSINDTIKGNDDKIKENKQEIDNLKNKPTDNLSEGEIAARTERIKQLQLKIDELTDSNKEYSKQLEQLDNDLEVINNGTGKLSEETQKSNDEIKAQSAALAQQAYALENREHFLAEHQARQKEFEAQQASFANNWGNLVQIGSSAIAMYGAVDGALKTINDDSATTGQRFAAIAGAIITVAGSYVQLIKGVQELTANTKTQNIVEALSVILFKRDEEGKARVQIANGRLIISNIGLNLSILQVVVALGAFVAIAGLVVFGIMKIIEANRAAEKELKESANSVQTLTDRYKELKNEYNELKTAIEDYNNAYNAFKELESGAEGYAEALENANDKARALIETYGLEGKWSYDANGAIVFDEGALDMAEAEKRSDVIASQHLANAAAVRNDEAIKNKVYHDNAATYISTQNNTISDDSNYTPTQTGGATKEQLDLLASINDEQYATIKSLDVNSDFASIASDIGLTEDKVRELSKTIGFLGDNADEARNTLVDVNQKEKEHLNNLASTIVEGSAAIQQITKGNTVANNAYANLLSHDKEYQKQAAADAKNSSSSSRDEVKQLLTAHGEDIGPSLTNEGLANSYLKYVLGMSDEEITKTTYEGGTGKGTAKDSEGNVIIELNNDVMERGIENAIRAQDLAGNTANGETAQEISSIIKTFMDMGSAGEAVLQGLQNYDPESEEGIPINLADISPEQFEKIEEAAEKIGGAYKDALTEALANYNEEDYNKRQEEIQSSQIDSDAESTKVDLEKLKMQGEIIQENNEAFRDNANAAKQLALNNTRLNSGMQDLISNWKKWKRALTSTDKTTDEYTSTLVDMRACIGSMLGLSEEMTEKLSSSFLDSADTINLMNRAATGDAKAVEELGFAAARAVTDTMELSEEMKNAKEGIHFGEDFVQPQEFEGRLAEIKNYLGATIDQMRTDVINGNIKPGDAIDDASFADKLNEMARLTGMTVQEMQSYLNSLGMEANIETTPVETTSYVPVVETWEEIKNNNKKEVEDGYYLKSRTYTKTVEQIPVKEMKMVPQIAFSNDGSRKPKMSYVGRGTVSPSVKSAAKGGGGGGSKSKEKKETKNANDEIKRYEVIDNKLEKTEDRLSAVKEAKDSAFGVEKLQLMNQELGLLNTKLDQTKKKLNEARDYRNKANGDLAKIANKWGGIVEDGVIVNYKKIVEDQINAYNRAVETYNNSAQEDSDKEALKRAEERYAEFKKDYEKYNETEDLIDDLENEVKALENEIVSAQLDLIKTEIDYNVQVNDDDLELLDFLLEQIEKKSYSAADAINNLGNQAADMMDKIAGYQRGISDILTMENTGLSQSEVNGFLSGNISANAVIAKGNFTEEQQEQLKEYAKSIKEVTAELVEMRENAYAKLSETLDEFTEDINEQKDAISSSINVLNNYKNVIDTLGKKNLGLTSDTLKSIADVQLVAAKGNVDISRSSMESIKNTLDELMATSTAGMSDAEKKLLQDQIDYYTKSYHEALETYTSDLSAAAQEVANIFEVAINNICDSFSEAIGGLSANLADLQTRFDQSNTLKDQTLADYERLYQLNKLNKKINDSIDDSTTVKSKQLLASLQDEINKKEAQGVELSEYDLDVYQRRYELYLAQIALEEAQNAKSQVRMTKDSNGNWSYTYVADDDKMQKAQEEYENKLYEYAKLNEDYVKETESTILSLEAEFKDALAALDPTDGEYEKKKQELMDYYNARLKFYSGQLANALKSNEEVASYEEAADWNVATSFGDTILGQLIGTGDLDTYMNDVFKAMTEAVEKASEAYEEYQGNLSDTVGDLVDLNDTVSGAIEDVVAATDTAKNKAVELSETFETAFDEADTALKEFSDNYSTYIDGMITKTEQLLNLINQLYEIKSGENSGKEIPDIQTPTGFDTGGYTGAWGSMGKLAILHEKELVLNANDTRNFLQTMNYMRELTNALDARAAFASTGLGEMNSLAVGEHMQQLEQEVHISANFPNVVNHLEIEEAFNNLVNMASQYVNRK